MVVPASWAAEFGARPIHPDLTIAVATPVQNGRLYNLVILEQIASQRSCWQESGDAPTVVDPLLLDFDFTGVCDRKTDSNGYSIRINGQDLGVNYRLEITKQQDDLVLMARPTRDYSVPAIEVGHTHGIADGLLKIDLNPGWTMSQRTYNGQPLSHIYLNHDQPLDMPLASSAVPSLGSTINTPPPDTPSEPRPPVLTTPPPPPATSSPQVPSGNYYRVVVPIRNNDTLQQVRSVEPEAFRTSVNGETVVQVGLFQERQRADEMVQELAQANLPAKIVNATAPRTATVPTIPNIPQGNVVVVIDPGHGGRDPGAIGIGGLQEKGINLTIAQRVKQQLERSGNLTVIMTRSGDDWVDLAPRSDLANRLNANVFVSIHANSISLDRPDINGLETYYYSSGQRLAQSIHSSVLRHTDLSDRGIRTARFYVLRHTDMPAVLVETGFVTGQVDVARFRDPTAVNQIADAIAQGILDYLGR